MLTRNAWGSFSSHTNTDHYYEKNKISANLISENLSSIFPLIWISLITGVIKHKFCFEFWVISTFSFINYLWIFFANLSDRTLFSYWFLRFTYIKMSTFCPSYTVVGRIIASPKSSPASILEPLNMLCYMSKKELKLLVELNLVMNWP